VRRGLSGGLELDDDPARIDLDAVHRYLSEEAYWASGRTREQVAEHVASANRVVGLYDGDAQIGYTRTACVAGMPVAYLYDVYVLPDYRGRGLGVELVRETVDEGPFADHKWLLDTDDAQELYRRFGFGPADDRHMQRPRRDPAR
jgi:ribosomal protein S18 acetylase RimI-like enzyme